MTEAQDYLKIQPVPERQKEALGRGDLIWQDGETRIYYPDNPLIPAGEGIHLRIESAKVPAHPKTPQEWKEWNRHWAKTIGAGKVVSEGRALPDMWQSFVGQTEYSPSDHLVTEIIGRNPEGKSWGRTAPFPGPLYDNRGARIPQEQVIKFKETLSRYFDRFWMPDLEKVSLFSDGLTVFSPESDEFKEVFHEKTHAPYPWQSEPVIATNLFDIIAVLHPHLRSGIHFVVELKNPPRRAWRDLNTSLQALSTAESVAQLLEENTFNGEPLAVWTSVRATGSWFGGFQEFLKDPSFKNQEIPRKWLKRKYKGAKTRLGVKDWTMNFHPHVYGARYADELIRLAQRPKHEGEPDWEGIEVMPEEKRLIIRDILNAKLPEKLENA